MAYKNFITRALLLSLVLVAIVACNSTEAGPTAMPTPTTEPVSANDLAVCDAYQNLVNAWPADTSAVQAAGPAQDIYLAIEEAGAALATAGLSADDPELGQVGEKVGNAAVRAIELTEELRAIGWIDFFDESRIGGDALSQLCFELEQNETQVNQNLNESFSSTIKPPEIPSIDPIVGTWTGSALNDGFEMQVSITIEKTCQLGQVCGRFNNQTISCSGTLTWVGMDGELYEFQAGDKTAVCGEGIDYLVPQTDGTVMYISRGDYGETKGILQKEP